MYVLLTSKEELESVSKETFMPSVCPTVRMCDVEGEVFSAGREWCWYPEYCLFLSLSVLII